MNKQIQLNTFINNMAWIKFEQQIQAFILSNVDDCLLISMHFRPPSIKEIIDCINTNNSFKKVIILDIMNPSHLLEKDFLILSKLFNNLIYISNYNLYSHKYVKTIYFDLALYAYEVTKPLMFNRSFKRKYICLNGKPHHHRLETLYELYKTNLLKDGYVSGYLDVHNKTFIAKNIHTFSKNFLNLFPIFLDHKNMRDQSAQKINFQFDLIKYNYKTPINIVTETSVRPDIIYISEKIIKAILSKQIMFLIGNKNTYSYLNKVYGFKNLDILNTDQICDKPFKALPKYTSFLKSNSLEDIEKLYYNTESVLDYNYDRLLKEIKYICLYNLHKQLINYV